MDSIFRAAVVYLILLLLFRINGKRTLAQITTFDFILLLIVAEAIQQAMVDTDNSITNAVLVVITLLGIDILLSLLKGRSWLVEKLVDDVPLVIVADGHPLKDRMTKERIDEGDVLIAAREAHGLERMDQIKYAVLERSGGISIIPKPSA